MTAGGFSKPIPRPPPLAERSSLLRPADLHGHRGRQGPRPLWRGPRCRRLRRPVARLPTCRPLEREHVRTARASLRSALAPRPCCTSASGPCCTFRLPARSVYIGSPGSTRRARPPPLTGGARTTSGSEPQIRPPVRIDAIFVDPSAFAGLVPDRVSLSADVPVNTRALARHGGPGVSGHPRRCGASARPRGAACKQPDRRACSTT